MALQTLANVFASERSVCCLQKHLFSVVKTRTFTEAKNKFSLRAKIFYGNKSASIGARYANMFWWTCFKVLLATSVSQQITPCVGDAVIRFEHFQIAKPQSFEENLGFTKHSFRSTQVTVESYKQPLGFG